MQSFLTRFCFQSGRQGAAQIGKFRGSVRLHSLGTIICRLSCILIRRLHIHVKSWLLLCKKHFQAGGIVLIRLVPDRYRGDTRGVSERWGQNAGVSERSGRLPSDRLFGWNE